MKRKEREVMNLKVSKRFLHSRSLGVEKKKMM